MKQIFILAIFLVVVIGGFLVAQNILQDAPAGKTINSTQKLLLSSQDLQDLGMIIGENGCQTEEYQTSDTSPRTQYSVCFYDIPNLNNTEVIIELKKFNNIHDLNGTYQYDSSHLFSAEGLISENTFGDQSRFRRNNVNDYMGHLNDPNLHAYNLWITKDLYLIHVTSRGTVEAEDLIEEIGQRILSKF